MAPKKGMKVNNKNRATARRTAPGNGAGKVQKMIQKMQIVPQQLPQMGDAAMRYAAALTNPFSKEAEGVRVPEPYAIATVSRKVHVPFILTSNSSGSVDFAVQPHLISSTVQFLGTATGGVGTFTPINMPGGMAVRSALTLANLRSTYQMYRIVSVGVRIKTNLDFTRSGGRVYGAVLPATQEQPAAFSGDVDFNSAARCYEIPTDGTSISSNIINLPRSFQFSVSELMSEGGVEVHFPICSARALDFLDGQDQSLEQSLIATALGGAVNSRVGTGMFATAGFSQFVFRADGVQASSDVFSVEVIYHVEGVPLVGLNGLMESMPHTPAPSGPHEIHLAHRLAAALPVVSYVSSKLKALEGGKYANFAKRGGQIAGAAERVLGIAMRGLAL